MIGQNSNAQRREYLNLTYRLHQHWLAVLDQPAESISEIYWDLLIGLWRHDEPVCKSDALRSITSVKSLSTARKYLRLAQQQNWIHEVGHPADARFRLVMLSPNGRTRLDAFFDAAIVELVYTSGVMDQIKSFP